MTRDSQAGTITVKRPVVPESVRNAIFERDGNKCVLCASTDNLQLDHKVSLSKGGKTEGNNLQTLCEQCNKTKGAGKKSLPYITTRLKLHNPITAIAELNKMDGVYSETPTLVNDNRVVNIYVPSEEGKANIKRVMEGERT